MIQSAPHLMGDQCSSSTTTMAKIQISGIFAIVFLCSSIKGTPYGEFITTPVERDCLALHDIGYHVDGVYLIDPSQSGHPIRVYCDMTNEGGGWTVIQQRVDDSINFYRRYDTYIEGFGSVTGNHWLGLDSIYQLTRRDKTNGTELYVFLEDFDGNSKYARYSGFDVKDHKDFYRLRVTGYTGTAGDALAHHNNRRFSAFDLDVDDHATVHCAETFKGAWWYGTCHDSNLNGYYLGGPFTSYGDGMVWQYWKGDAYSLKTTVMKVRRLQ